MPHCVWHRIEAAYAVPHRRRACGGIFSYYSIIGKNLQQLCLGQFLGGIVQNCRHSGLFRVCALAFGKLYCHFFYIFRVRPALFALEQLLGFLPALLLRPLSSGSASCPYLALLPLNGLWIFMLRAGQPLQCYRAAVKPILADTATASSFGGRTSGHFSGGSSRCGYRWTHRGSSRHRQTRPAPGLFQLGLRRAGRHRHAGAAFHHQGGHFQHILPAVPFVKCQQHIAADA